MVVQCEECGMWQIVYSKYKLTDNESEIIKSILDNYAYTCGSSMEDLNLCGRLSTVCIRIVRYYEPLEVHYYALGHELLCIYCCSACQTWMLPIVSRLFIQTSCQKKNIDFAF